MKTIKNKQLYKENKLKEKVSYILLKSKKLCDSLSISINKSKTIKISTRLRKTESIEINNNETVIKITAFYKNKKGTVLTTNLNKKSMKNALIKAINIAKNTSKDDFFKLADPELLCYKAPFLNLFHPTKINIKERIKIAKDAELYALKMDKKIKNSERSLFKSSYNIRVFGNTHGMLESYSSSIYLLYICVIAEKNGIMQKDYDYSISRSFENLKSPKIIGKKAAYKALKKLLPKKISKNRLPVIFKSNVATDLFFYLYLAIKGSNIYNQYSFLRNNLNKQIFPKWINITENPHIPCGLASTPFDNEGVKTQFRKIIEDGILKTWMLDTYYGKKMNLNSTGHSGDCIYNWIIKKEKNQNISFQELTKKMHTGIIITELIGEGVNIVTGDYSKGISGFFVKNGVLQYPICESTVSGNLIEIWNNIIDISDDDIEKRMNIQCGSILISEINISGKN